MKILRKFFLVSLFCSLFVFSASASEIDFSYSEKSLSWLENNKIILDNLENYISSHSSDFSNLDYVDLSNDNNVFLYSLGFSNSTRLWTYILYNDSSLNSSFDGTNYSFFGYLVRFNIENNNIVSHTISGQSSVSSRNFSNDIILDYRFGKNTSNIFKNTSTDSLLLPNNSFISPNDSINLFELSNILSGISAEPSYSYVSNVLDNGNVELTFTFENYDSDSFYGFTIENKLSGEQYGIENPFSSIFPNIIPFGNSYSITIPYDTYLYVTLAKYNKIEDSSLYYREEISTDVIDVNNIVFSNPSNPYFSIDYQSKNFIQGRFSNTKKNDTCYVKFSNNSNSQQVSCSESFTIDFDFNGYLSFYVKRRNDIIYNRNVNILGNNTPDYPYITYNIKKQDFYSVVNFNVINYDYDNNMSYRYSLDNGATWTDYQLINNNSPSYSINIFSNSNVIFEIANVTSPDNIIVYDSKSVYVVIDISTASGLNSSTDNIIDKFISLISLNDDLVNYINLLWNNFKNSKFFLIIMIPFLSSIICAIIYLIRRK